MFKYSMVILAFVKVTAYSGWTLCLEPFIEISGFLLELSDIIFCDLHERGRERDREERQRLIMMVSYCIIFHTH